MKDGRYGYTAQIALQSVRTVVFIVIGRTVISEKHIKTETGVFLEEIQRHSLSTKM